MKKSAYIFITILFFGIVLVYISYRLLSKDTYVIPTDLSTQGTMVEPIDTGSGAIIKAVSQDSGSTSTLGQVPLNTVCPQGIQIERDECITNIAVSSRNPKLCAEVRGILAQSYCVTTVTNKKTNSTQIITPYVQGQGISYITNTAQTLVSDSEKQLTDAVQNFVRTSIDQLDTSDALTDFYESIFNSSKVEVYTVQPFEAKPGSVVMVKGFGFKKSGNTVTIGGYSFSNVESSDGMSLSVIVPSLSEGTYSVSVSNGKISSNSSQVFIRITNNPRPAPVITSSFPEKPGLDDLITLQGTDIHGQTSVYTSLGEASGLSFRVSDLPYFSDLESVLSEIQEQSIPILVMIVSDTGFSEPYSVTVYLRK